MKLSMWIIADWLKDYEPEIQIKEGKLEIETFRLFSSMFESEDNCMYIGKTTDLFKTGKDQVICTHKNDILLLKTNDIDVVTNQILNAFEHYQSWNLRILEAISTGRRPADILRIANEVICEPVYLLDASQYAIALSESFGRGQVNELWDQMLDHGTSNIDFLTRLDEEYPEHRTNRGLYHFSVSFRKESGYNYNMFLKDQWVGACGMVERSEPIDRYMVDLFHIFCMDLELWYISHFQENESMMLDAMFRDVLLGSPVTEVFRRQFQLRFRSLKDKKYILVLTNLVEQPFLISHICKELNLMFPEVVAIIYQEYICVLLNCKAQTLDQFLQKIEAIMIRNGYFGSCSMDFVELEHISDRFHEALYTAKKASAAPGTINRFQDFCLPYALDEIKKNMPEGMIHPEVRKLIDYDEEHNTEFAETLRVYLEQERSQSKTAMKMNMHRNTLTYRLQRIRGILEADLDDPDVRLHIQLSFRMII